MALPKLDVPIHEVNLISNNKLVRFRPFLVKEQKLFLMAQESNDAKETIRVIKQVLKNCILDDIDIDSLPTFDLEWLFMHLRARSVEEVVELRYKCNNEVPDEKGENKKCNGVVDFKLNLLEIKPTKNPEHTDKFKLTDKLGICLKYPTFEVIEKYESSNQNEVMTEILADCVDFVYDDDQIYYAKDSSREEIKDFIDNLQQKDLEKIKKFFETIPELKKDVHFKCPKCSYEEDITISGLQNFFV
jgi:hypothetical protein